MFHHLENRTLQPGQIVLHDLPGAVQLNTEVLVSKPISHSRYVLPRNAWLLCSEPRGDVLGCLAYDLQPPDNRVLNEHAPVEALFSDALSMILDYVDGLEYILEI